MRKAKSTISAVLSLSLLLSGITIGFQSAGVQAAQSTYLSCDFEDGKVPSDWITKSGSYSVIDDANGGHTLQLSPYTRVIIPMPSGSGDYEIDADVTYTQSYNSARWASIMYRVQNKDYPYFQFAARQDTTASNGTEFALRNASNAWEVRSKAPSTATMADGKKHHMRLIVTGNRVKQFFDGMEMEFTDQAGDYLTGDIGIQTDNLTADFDNLTVSLNPDPLPAVPTPTAQYAEAKTLSSNLVDSPTVTCSEPTSLDQIKALIADSVTSSVLTDLKLEDGTLNVYGGATKIGTLQDVLGVASGKITMMFTLPDQATADALAAYITANKLEDLNVVSSDKDLLAGFRAKALTTRATLLVDSDSFTLDDVYALVADANEARCRSVIIRQSAADKAMVQEMQRRMLSVWVAADDTTVGYAAAITSGANGILTASPDKLKEAVSVFDSKTLTRKTFVIGHRGNPDNAPENTMASYKKAVEQCGADMIENDVWLTKDKKVIIMHDGTFTRTTDILTNTKIPDSVFTNGVTRQNCTPADLTLDQIKLLDAGSSFSASYAGEQIPTLDELFDYMKGKDIVLMLELKDASTGIEQATADIIKAHDIADQVNIITFNTASIPIFQSIMPGISCASLSGQTQLDEKNTRTSLRDALNFLVPMNAGYDPSYDYISNDQYIANATARGTQLWGWTYADQSNFAWAIDHGITGMTTNDAHWAKDYAFTLQAGQSGYTLAGDESVTVSADKVTQLKSKVACSPDIVVLDGSDAIQVSGSTITGVKAGTATVMLRTSTVMGSKTYTIYSQPLTVTVTSDGTGTTDTTSTETTATTTSSSEPSTAPSTESTTEPTATSTEVSTEPSASSSTSSSTVPSAETTTETTASTTGGVSTVTSTTAGSTGSTTTTAAPNGGVSQTVSSGTANTATGTANPGTGEAQSNALIWFLAVCAAAGILVCIKKKSAVESVKR